VEFRGEVQMDLLWRIKSGRALKKEKQPHRQTLFDRVGGIVREHGLKESFLGMLERYKDYLPGEEANSAKVRAKEDYTPPLFCLLTKRDYRLTRLIMNESDNPYLEYANSPEELLLSGPLFGSNASLAPDELRDHHFETLLLREFAKGHAKDPKG
jgi:hypothetical protein